MVIGFDRISHAELVGEARAAAAFDRETQSCGLVEFQPDDAHTGCRRCGEDYGIGNGGRVGHAAKIGGRCPTGNAAVSRGEGKGFAPSHQEAKIERRRLSHLTSWRIGSCRSVGSEDHCAEHKRRPLASWREPSPLTARRDSMEEAERKRPRLAPGPPNSTD